MSKESKYLIRGRPPKSDLRENIEQIVNVLGVSYGYEIYKLFNEIFHPIKIRTVYYHLKEGVKIGVFEEIGERAIKGSFTWGDKSIRKYYIIGPNSTIKPIEKLLKEVKIKGIEKRDPTFYINWNFILNKKTKDFEVELKLILNSSLSTKEIKNKLIYLRSKIDSYTSWLNKYTDIKKLNEIKKKIEKWKI